jgi:hypothetical protein
MSVPRVDSAFFKDHAIDPDTIWFPYTAETQKWYIQADSAHLYSPYGLLRSPWNWNPAPYLTRYNNLNQIPTFHGIPNYLTKSYRGVLCADYETFVGSVIKDQPMRMFYLGLENDVHGSFHFTLGGQGGPHAYRQVADFTNFADENI